MSSHAGPKVIVVPSCLTHILSSVFPVLWTFKSAGRGKVLSSYKNNKLSDSNFWPIMIPSGLNSSGLLSRHSKGKTWITHSFSYTMTQRKDLFSLSNEGWCRQAFTASFQDLPIVSPALLASQKWDILYWLFNSDKQLYCEKGSESWLCEHRKDAQKEWEAKTSKTAVASKWPLCKKEGEKGGNGPLLSFIWRIKIPPHWYFNSNSRGLFVFEKPPSEQSKHTSPAHAQ